MYLSLVGILYVMLGWFEFSLVSMLFYGILNLLQKKAAMEKCNSATLMSTQFAVGSALAVISVFIFNDFLVNAWPIFLILAAVNGTVYLIGSLSRLESLKLIPLSVCQPVVKMDSALAALIGIVILGEAVGLVQALGILLAVVVVWVLSGAKAGGKSKNFKLGVGLALLTAVFFSVSDFTLKLAMAQSSRFMFLAVSYSMLFVPSLLLQNKMNRTTKAKKSTSIKWGVGFGLANFVAFSSLLGALQTGPLSIVLPLISMSVPIAVVLSVFIFKEKMTVRRIIGLLLAVAVVVMLSS